MLGFFKELAPVVFVSFGNVGFLLFLGFVGNRTFGRFKGWRFLPEPGDPPLVNVRTIGRELVQALEDAQQVFCDVGMGAWLALGEEGAKIR